MLQTIQTVIFFNSFRSDGGVLFLAIRDCSYFTSMLGLILTTTLFSYYLTHIHNIRGLLLLDPIVNWHVSKQVSFEVSLSLKLLVYLREFLLKICLKMFINERRKGIFS